MSERADWKITLTESERRAVSQLEVAGAVIKPFDVAGIDFHGTVVRFDNDQRTERGLISEASALSLSQLGNTLLELRQTTLNKRDLKCICQLKNLAGLDIAATSAATISWKTIAKLESLILLDASDNVVTNRDVSELKRLKKLRSLSLIGTSITDDCVADLALMTSLQELYLQRTKLSEEGLRQLRVRLPKCVINC